MRNYKLKINKANRIDKFDAQLKKEKYHLEELFARYSKYIYLGEISRYSSIEIVIYYTMNLLRFYYNGQIITPNELEERTRGNYKKIMKALQPEIKKLKDLGVI